MFSPALPHQLAPGNSRSARSGRAWPLPLHGEHPDHAALRHVRLRAANIVEGALHPLRIHAPAGLDRDVLHAVDGEGAGDAGDAGVRAPLPRGLTGFRVEGTKVPVVGSAGEDEPAPRGQDWTPVVWLERTHPHFLTGVHVPGLDLADVLRAVRDDHPDVLDLGAQPELALLVGFRRAQERAAEVLVGRDVQTSGLRIAVGRRPDLPRPR